VATPYRKDLPEVPSRMLDLDVDDRGYPVPYFVAVIDGKPDHRVADPAKLIACVRDKLCWVCGRRMVFPPVCVIGPMCGVNRVSSEPPVHEECARFSVLGCPFLSRPHAKRREAGMPGGLVLPPGTMIARNPGVMLLWWSQGVSMFETDRVKHGRDFLFDVGKPLAVEWWTEGRMAMRREAVMAIESGLPALEALCENDKDRKVLGELVGELLRWLPTDTRGALA